MKQNGKTFFSVEKKVVSYLKVVVDKERETIISDHKRIAYVGDI